MSNCPNCGAPADAGAARCAFCRTRLAAISCPSCFGAMFEQDAFCSRCGARRADTVAEDGAAPCPGCRTTLRRLLVGGTAILECGTCDGVWVDADTFELLCADRGAQAAVLHRFPDRPPAPADRIRYRGCARCGKMMNRVNFGRISGVVVDVCRGHGTYLDPGELHRIVEFIRAGGLERARGRQIDELREQERRLRELERRRGRDARAFTSPVSNTSAWRILIGRD